MILKIYCLYDSKAEAYLQPWFMRSKGEAIRAFAELASDSNTNVGKYPDDFTLFEIGEYHQEDGKLKPHTAKISLGVAIEHQKLSKNIHPVDPNILSMTRKSQEKELNQ